MKSKQLLSVVLSLIMFTGVSAGSAAFAETDELDDLLEDFCEIDAAEHDAFFDANPDLADFRDEITNICTIEDEIEREDAIDVFVEDNFPDAIKDDVIDDFEDCVEAGGVIGDNPDECTIDDMVFVNDEDDDDDDHEKVLVCHKYKKTLRISANAVDAHLNHGDELGSCDKNEIRYDDDDDEDDYDESKKNKLAEKQAKKEAKLAEKQARAAEKLAEREAKLTEKAQFSEERANKIIEKLQQRIQQMEERLQKLIDKYESGKYFGNLKNADAVTKSFTISFEGFASEISDSSNIESLTGDLYLENLVTGNNVKKFRVTGGELFIGDIEVYDVVFGKARLTSSGPGGDKDSMVVIAQTSNGVDVRTLKLSINLSESFDSDTESVDIEILSPRSKIASEWFLGATGTMGLTESVDAQNSEDESDVSEDDIPKVEIPDADIPITTAITVSTTSNVYFLGDEIIISGTVTDIFQDTPVILQTVTATDLIDIAQLDLANDGTFEHTILAEGPLWVTDTYTVKAFYGANNVAETTFEFTR